MINQVKETTKSILEQLDKGGKVSELLWYFGDDPKELDVGIGYCYAIILEVNKHYKEPFSYEINILNEAIQFIIRKKD